MPTTENNALPRSAADPSPRTLESMYREIKSLEDKFAVKFAGYDDAVKLLQEFTNRQPTTESVSRDLIALSDVTEVSLKAAEKLTCEKFKGVQDRFKELDLRYDQLDGSNKEAISAALRAAEKAVEKTEVNFTKQIDGLSALNGSTRTALESNISDLKERVTIIEANRQGAGLQKAETRDDSRYLFMIFGAIIGVAGIAAGFLR